MIGRVWLNRLRAVRQALTDSEVTLADMRLHVPGTLPLRLSVVMGNLRMQAMFDSLLRPGDVVVDVGANIGYNTCYAAHRVGPSGRVFAIEPAQDNLRVLYTNLFANHLHNIFVYPYAAGQRRTVQTFFLRGDISAVNSLSPDNFYAAVTETVEVIVAPLDDLIPVVPNLVKIDVEGAELDVLHGMPRLLNNPSLRLIVEWHPTLQQAAGHAPTALPEYLWEQGFSLQAIDHLKKLPLNAANLSTLTQDLLAKRRPVELLAQRFSVE